MAERETFSTRDTVIEGVSNDVFAVCSTICVLVFACLWYLQTPRNTRIHPQFQEQVGFAREHLGLNTDDTSSAQNQDRPSSNSNPPRVFERHVAQCPICLAQPRFLTFTNCGHGFCGNCIITYWRHGRWMGAVNCPVCRQRVSMLFMNFSAADRTEEDHNETVSNINDYNRRFSGEPRPILDRIRDIPTLLSQMWNELFSVQGLVVVLRLRIVFWFAAGILYLVSPMDILPEAVFGVLGLLDDILIFSIILIYIAEIYRQAVVRRAMGTET